MTARTGAIAPSPAARKHMPDLETELTAFMRRYELATNRHDFGQLAPLIAGDATYWFTEGSYHGIEAIRSAIERTFATIRNEVYQIKDLEWVVVSAELAACRYRFSWNGVIDGQPESGSGRGTNVLTKRDGTWKMLHEHLSP
jgi:ketosteroid isomerase-like protein